MVSMLPLKMRFRIAHQNEEKLRVAANSVAHPETRSLDLAERGGDQNRMIRRRLIISSLDLVGGGREASVAADEGEEVVVVEEVEAVRGLEKTNGYLRGVDTDDICRSSLRFQGTDYYRPLVCNKFYWPEVIVNQIGGLTIPWLIL